MDVVAELKSLDWRDPGRWPFIVRMGMAGIFFVLLAIALNYFLVWNQQRPVLDDLQSKEQQLRSEFRTKHSKAINLDLYKQQLADIQKSFGALLRQLPSKTEVDNLLIDISQTGLAAALQDKLFEPQEEVKKDFYAEKSIKIRLTGGFHQFANFTSGIAALPRIVTLHDVEIKPTDRSASYDQLQMELTAKTYRYLDDEEIAAAEAERRKAEAAKKHVSGG